MSISRQANGKWKVRWRDSQGRHSSKTFERNEKKLAQEFELLMKRAKRSAPSVLRRLEAEMDGGRKPLGEVFNEWWETHAENLKPKTANHYRWLANSLILPHLGDMPISAITIRDVEDWLNRVQTGPVAKRQAGALLAQLFNTARRWGYVQENPVELAQRPKTPQRKAIRPPTPETVEAIRDKLELGDATLVSVLAYAGLRPQEALGLKWADVRERTLLIDAPKTNRSRAVTILSPLAADLNYWRMAAEPNELVFPSKRGNLITEKGWHNWRARVWRPVAPDIRPYDLRHTFVSLLIHEGRSVVEVAQQAGHSPQVCLSNYAHVFAEFGSDDRVSAEELILRARTRDVPLEAV